MITNDIRWSLSRDKNPVPSRWLATTHFPDKEAISDVCLRPGSVPVACPTVGSGAVSNGYSRTT
jgi:hypothetical protein